MRTIILMVIFLLSCIPHLDAQETRDQLKNRFKAGKRITQESMYSLIDSMNLITDTLQVDQVETFAALATASPTDNSLVWTLGRGSAGDGGAAPYFYDRGSSEAVDDVMVALGPSGEGRYIYALSVITSIAAGCKGDDFTNNTLQFQRMLDSGIHIVVTPGTYLTDQLTVPAGLSCTFETGAQIKMRTDPGADQGIFATITTDDVTFTNLDVDLDLKAPFVTRVQGNRFRLLGHTKVKDCQPNDLGGGNETSNQFGGFVIQGDDPVIEHLYGTNLHQDTVGIGSYSLLELNQCDRAQIALLEADDCDDIIKVGGSPGATNFVVRSVVGRNIRDNGVYMLASSIPHNGEFSNIHINGVEEGIVFDSAEPNTNIKFGDVYIKDATNAGIQLRDTTVGGGLEFGSVTLDNSSIVAGTVGNPGNEGFQNVRFDELTFINWTKTNIRPMTFVKCVDFSFGSITIHASANPLGGYFILLQDCDEIRIGVLNVRRTGGTTGNAIFATQNIFTAPDIFIGGIHTMGISGDSIIWQGTARPDDRSNIFINDRGKTSYNLRISHTEDNTGGSQEPEIILETTDISIDSIDRVMGNYRVVGWDVGLNEPQDLFGIKTSSTNGVGTAYKTQFLDDAATQNVVGQIEQGLMTIVIPQATTLEGPPAWMPSGAIWYDTTLGVVKVKP